MFDITTIQYPIECFNQVERQLGKNLSIELCQGATDGNRAACIALAPNYLDKFEKTQLCRLLGARVGANSTELIASEPIGSSSPVDCLQSLRSSCIRLNSLLFQDTNGVVINQPELRRQEKSLLLDLCASTSIPSSLSPSLSPSSFASVSKISLTKIRSECLKKAACDVGRTPHANTLFNSLGKKGLINKYCIIIFLFVINNHLIIFYFVL